MGSKGMTALTVLGISTAESEEVGDFHVTHCSFYVVFIPKVSLLNPGAGFGCYDRPFRQGWSTM